MTDAQPLGRVLQRLRFRHLQLLVTLRTVNSLSAAAVTLNLSQSALSKMLQEVEEVLGCVLFERLPRGLKITPKGEVVVQMAVSMLNELGHVSTRVAAPELRSCLRLGCTPVIAQALLPQVLRVLLERHACEVTLLETGVPRLFEELHAGRLDALITQLPSARALHRHGLRATPLFESGMCVVAPRELAHRLPTPVALSALLDRRWIVSPEQALGRQAFEDLFRRAGVPLPQDLLISSSPSTNLALVAAGVGLAFVPTLALQCSPAAAQVQPLSLAMPIPTAMVALVHRQPSDAIQALQRAVRMCVKDAAGPVPGQRGGGLSG